MNVTIGARVIKTGIAVALALYFTELFGFQPGDRIIACVAALFTLQPSVYRSWQHLLEQVQSNTLGAVLAVGIGYLLPVNELVIGLTCIIVILITLALRMESAVSLTLVTVIVVLLAGSDWEYALHRFLLILLGIGVAFAVNAVILPPNNVKQFLDGYRSAVQSLSLLLRTAISDELKETEAKALREQLNNTVRKLNEWYGMLEEEWRKWSRFRPQPSRQLVVQKQMLKTIMIGVEALDTVEEHYFSQRNRGNADQTFDACLEEMIKFHEFTLLKYEGKMKQSDQMNDKVEEDLETLLRRNIEYAAENADSQLMLVVIASAMYEYGHQLRRLDRMISHMNASE
ncbi:FUSC family protein [Paenibacillus thermotolerans]|uniref:FUSC family protein n=1 Tax=Paenibacillus thermotolerans TaxID=3027807 RepID=UPI002367C0F6|nr:MULTISPECIES: aromatic acid exporter family protein [unclassified Paenibacillus]